MFKNNFIIKKNVASFSNLTDKMSDIYPTLKARKMDAVVQMPETKIATTFRTSIIYLKTFALFCDFMNLTSRFKIDQ